jgi:hypothetical protein
MAEKESRVKSAMGGEKKPSKKKSDGKKSKHKIHVMHIRHADNGGWIAQHDFEPPELGSMESAPKPAPKPEDHIVPPGIENLQAHVGDHMSQEPEPEPQAPAAPPSSPAGPMAGM